MKALGFVWIFVMSFLLGAVSFATQKDLAPIGAQAKKQAQKAWRSNPKARAVFVSVQNMKNIYQKRTTDQLIRYSNWAKDDLALGFLQAFSKRGGEGGVEFMVSHLVRSYTDYIKTPDTPRSKAFYAKLTSLSDQSYQGFSKFLFLSGDVCASRNLNAAINFFTQMENNVALFFFLDILQLFVNSLNTDPHNFYVRVKTHAHQAETRWALNDKNDNFYDAKTCEKRMDKLAEPLLCSQYAAIEGLTPKSRTRDSNIRTARSLCEEIFPDNRTDLLLKIWT